MLSGEFFLATVRLRFLCGRDEEAAAGMAISSVLGSFGDELGLDVFPGLGGMMIDRRSTPGAYSFTKE